MKTEPPPPPAGADLKASALAKMADARAILDSAIADLCNLEGPGYLAVYESAKKISYDKLPAIEGRLRNLKPPTGVFHP